MFGVYPAPNVSAYVASKFAVLGMSQSLRAELAPHKIGVTAICPGMIATSIIDGGRMSGKIAQRRSKMREMFAQRGAPPEHVAEAILDSVRTNPAVRPVGRDGWAIYAMHRLSPRATQRFGASIAGRLGGRP